MYLVHTVQLLVQRENFGKLFILHANVVTTGRCVYIANSNKTRLCKIHLNRIPWQDLDVADESLETPLAAHLSIRCLCHEQYLSFLRA